MIKTKHIGSYQSHFYEGSYDQRQLNGNQFKKSRFHNFDFNNYQDHLYKTALFGLFAYQPKVIEKMDQNRVFYIKKTHIKTQYVLNIWKQERINYLANNYLKLLFRESKLASEIITKYENIVIPEYLNKMSFKDLKITKEQIVDKLIEEKILPKHFYSLQEV